ncbi:MAG: DUF1345 domain-containing protein [Sphingomonas sp.]|nr:DUF1345 domain-containing protein [Sphingomonas sp.]
MAGRPARTIGNRLAPARFIVFALLLAAGIPAAALLLEDWLVGIMLGFDGAALVFLLSCLPLVGIGDAATIRDHARNNDANRTMLLLLSGIVSVVVLATIAAEMAGGQQTPWPVGALIVATLLIAWLFSNMTYALHYAHLFYGGRGGGIDFPKTREPVYSDFIYFAFTLGMTFQTSDVAIADPAVRRIATLHCLAAFVFNLGVLAFTINVLGG